MRRAAEVRVMERVVEIEIVVAARRGERVVAIMEVRERMARIRSRRQRGQFYTSHIISNHSSYRQEWGEGSTWLSEPKRTKRTRGSFGSSLGWGTSNIFPVLSYFRFLSRATACSSSLLRSSSRTKAVPGTWWRWWSSRMPRPMFA